MKKDTHPDYQEILFVDTQLSLCCTNCQRLQLHNIISKNDVNPKILTQLKHFLMKFFGFLVGEFLVGNFDGVSYFIIGEREDIAHDSAPQIAAADFLVDLFYKFRN